MKITSPDKAGLPANRQLKQQAQARIVILAVISFLAGVVATTVWFRLMSEPGTGDSSAPVSSSQTDNESAAMQAAQQPHASGSTQSFVAGPLPVDAAAVAEVKQAVPNYASVSLADGEQMLRDAALKKFAAATREMETQITEAEKQLAQAQTGQSAAAVETARKQLQQIQAGQSAKLQQIAGQLATELTAWRQLKGAAQ